MATLRLSYARNHEPLKFYFENIPEEKKFIKEIPGITYATTSKKWNLKLDPMLAYIAQGIFESKGGILKYDADVQKYLDDFSLMTKERVLLYGQEDVEGTYPLYEKLYPLQRVDVEFIANSPTKYTLNANDRAVGKTVESIAVSERLNAKKILCVVKSAHKYSWQTAWSRWANRSATVCEGPRKKRLEELQQEADIHIINYEMVKDPEYARILLKRDYDLLIVDEAHKKIANHKSGISKAMKTLRKRAKFVTVLTGTPMPKSREQIFGILHFLDPVRFSSYWNFIDAYFIVDNEGFGKTIGGLKHEKMFQYMLAPFTLNRDKREVHRYMKEPVIESPIRIAPSSAQLKRIEYLREWQTVSTAQEDILCTNAATVHLRERQLAISAEMFGIDEKSPKLEAMAEDARDFIDDGRKVVIFTWFNKATEIIAKYLKDSNINVEIINGNTKPEYIHMLEKRFHDDDSLEALVLTIGTGGEGLNLQAGSVCMFSDVSYLPGDNDQAKDRIDRPGQMYTPIIRYYITKGTIEEDIYSLVVERGIAINSAQDLEKVRTHLRKKG